MKLRLYQVDAFTDKLFGGNPAAVCPLESWLSDALMQNIAMENNLAETAFYVNRNDVYEIRWFTPVSEVDLCGHATLASAHVLFNHENYKQAQINFHSPRSGALSVSKNGDWLTLNFPTDTIEKVELTKSLTDGFNITPTEAYKGKMDFMLVFENEDVIKNIEVDFRPISKLGSRGVIITAKGNEVDFVSRYFAPQFGIDEDPVTGSAHTTLIPYWSKHFDRLSAGSGRNELTAMQLSKRRGYLKCKHLGERVEISGQARTYLIGEIEVD